MVCKDGTNVDPTFTLWLRLVVDVLLACSIVLLNAFIMYAVVRYHRKLTAVFPHASNVSALLVLNLSAADFVEGVSFVYMFLPRYLCSLAHFLEHHFALCVLRSVLVYIGHFSSGFSLVAIALDRYIAVFHALRYGEIMTTRRAVATIVFVWTLSVFLSSMLFYWNTWKDGELCVVFTFQPMLYDVLVVTMYQCVVVVSVTAVYWRIHRLSLKIVRRTSFPEVRATSTGSSLILLKILIVFIVSWEPYMISLYIKYYGYNVPTIVFEVGSSILKIAYLANPFIYALNTRSVRYCIVRALNSCRGNEMSKANFMTSTSMCTISTDSLRTAGTNTANDTTLTR